MHVGQTKTMVEAGISSTVSPICDNELGDEEEDESFCLNEMLGGILFRGMEEWKEEEDNDNNEEMSSPDNANEQNKIKNENKSKNKNKNTTKLHGRVDPLNCVSRRRKRSSTMSMNSDTIQIAKENDDDTIFKRAFYRNTNTNKNHNTQSNMTKEEEKEEHPPLQICTIHNRGKGLVATNLIPKGSCIFTEQASVAAQVPPPSSTLKEEAKSNSNSNSNRNNNNDNNNNKYWSPIQACQYCFCSLESSNTISLHKPLPHQELWPILKLDFDNDNNHDSDPDSDSGSFTRIDNDDDHRNTSKKSSTRLLVDKYGRVKCTQCNLLFCSKRCYTNQIHDYGSCCYLKRINDEHLHNQNLCLDEAPVTIAAKLFCHVTHSVRNHNQQQTTQHGSGATSGGGSADELLEKNFVFGLCGSSDNLTTLEIGIANNRRSYHDNDDDDDDDNDDDNNDEKRTDTNTVAVVYTLKPLYSFLTDLLNLSSHEQEFLSLDLLHSLACKAARNGFDIQTQSPFKPYVRQTQLHFS